MKPFNLIDFVHRRTQWNHFELSKLLKLDVEKTKCLLTLCGYNWDNKIKMYCLNSKDNLNEKIDKLEIIKDKCIQCTYVIILYF